MTPKLVTPSTLLLLTLGGTLVALTSCTGSKPSSTEAPAIGSSATGAASTSESQNLEATSGETTTQDTKAATPTSASTLEVKEEVAQCLTFAFRHQATPSHQPGPDCIEHQNRVEIPEALRNGKFDLNQLCVRVDGVAVQALRKENQLILAGTSRSNSLISVRGCPNGKLCMSDCRVTRDALLDDLVGESDVEADGYDAEAAKKVTQSLSAELKRELAQLDEDDINANWVQVDAPEKSNAQACARSAGKKRN